MGRTDSRHIFMMTFVLFGILLSMQFKSTFTVNRHKLSIQKQIDEYKSQLEQEKLKAEQLIQEIRAMEKNKETLLNEYIKEQNNSYLNMQKSNLDRVSLIAGLTDVKGPGVVVKLDDAPARNLQDPNENPMDLIIHDSDVIMVLNELKKAGAQALSINDERVVSTSEQVCAGPNILINDKRYPVPYVIKAIGDPDKLYNSVNESRIVFLLKRFRIRVDITKSNEIIIPRYEYLKQDGLVRGVNQ